jgi:D-amino-acid oxidase
MGQRVTVVGAGVVGLTCAVELAEAGWAVDVLAREMPLETTSAVAGGLWMPFLAEPVDAVDRWARLTLDRFLELADDKTGIVVRAGYLLGHGYTRPSWAAGRPMLELAAVANPAPGHPHGWHLRSPIVDMQVYLPYLVRRLEDAGGTLTRMPLTALPTRGLVVNCTGLAARALAADPTLHPIRGQVVRTTNPGITNWWSDDSDPARLTYVLPQTEEIVVGGVAQDGDWSTTPDAATADQIMERACALVPALRAATVLSHRVGLRPGRPRVRLETVPGPDGTTVHCYGHGGSGITLSWGCAQDVAAELTAIAARH